MPDSNPPPLDEPSSIPQPVGGDETKQGLAKRKQHVDDEVGYEPSRWWHLPNELFGEALALCSAEAARHGVTPQLNFDPHEYPAPPKHSPSPLPDLWPPMAVKRSDEPKGIHGEAKRERSPRLMTSEVLDVDIHMLDAAADVQDPPRAIEHPVSANNNVESGGPHATPPSVVREHHNIVVAPDTPEVPHSSRMVTHYASVADTWLLDAAVSSNPGMLVEVTGSREFRRGIAWHGGDYEGAHGVVLSVLNTGGDNETFPSTARVKFQKPLHPSVTTFAVPVSLLRPVQPDAVGQRALIVGGEYKGHTAELLEEVSDGWFVAAAYDYFEVACEDLVRVLAIDS